MAEYDKHGFITKLDKNEIFVFGSNGSGFHGGGAAATAVHKFGAKMGQAEGLQGQSYAINTMGSEDEMFAQIKRFIHSHCNIGTMRLLKQASKSFININLFDRTILSVLCTF